MTPKEKAKELVEKMYQYQWRKDTIEFRNAKQCVLILVNEMLNNFLSNTTTKYGRERYKYWQNVKQEIRDL